MRGTWRPFLSAAALAFAAALVASVMPPRPEREDSRPAPAAEPSPAADPGLGRPVFPGAEATVPPPSKGPFEARLAAAGVRRGDPVFIRVFKAERVMEVWTGRDGRFALFDVYPVCAVSGALGPKLAEGDGQAPEGFYEVGKRQLNPNSAYHLAFNLGFPNAYDRAQGRTGSFLMVHGACASIGCYAMTDQGIEEIYALVEAALSAGQRSVPVHAFPFRLTAANFAAADSHDWLAFWRDELKPGFDAFERDRVPPRMAVCAGRYAVLEAGAEGCERIAAW